MDFYYGLRIEQRGCAAFHSRRESISGESPASFLEDISMPYSGFEPEPTGLQAECHKHHTSSHSLHDQEYGRRFEELGSVTDRPGRGAHRNIRAEDKVDTVWQTSSRMRIERRKRFPELLTEQ
ncbi:hypothetical protein TNCV_728081 [Trichonephila clavipes]|nr:hypothetical protein TNCV_728081 [Trichonephila clavipes]